MVLDSGNSLLLCCSQWWTVFVWYVGPSWSPGCSCWLWGQRPEWPPTTKLAFVHDHLAASTGNSESFSASPNLPWILWTDLNPQVSSFHQTQVRSLTRRVSNSLTKTLVPRRLEWFDCGLWRCSIKSFEDSSFKASLALAFLQFGVRARGYLQILLRKNSAKKQV